MTTEIINNITLGTIMPFFAFNVNTSYICQDSDVNSGSHGCILTGQPGYLDQTGNGNEGHRWMRFSSIQSRNIAIDGSNSDQSSQYPAALSQPPENDYTLLPTSWITGNKDNNGSTVCYKLGPTADCDKCTNTPTYQPVCTNKITAINTASKMTNIKKPWYSKPDSHSYTKSDGDNSWPTSDPRGMCGMDKYKECRPLPGGGISCQCDDGGNCSTIKNVCVGTTTGNVELRGVKQLFPVSGSNQDVDIGIAGVIVGCDDSNCQEGGGSLNENIQNVGGKFIKEINQDCFDSTKFGKSSAYYGLPQTIILPDNGNIQNEPSALDTPNWTNKPTNGFNLAVNYTANDLFATNDYVDCGARNQNQECSYVGGIGNLLYMPPLWPDENKLRFWINGFKNNYIGIKTYSPVNPIKLPDFLIPWVLTMATINMMPRYLVINLFGMYGTSESKGSLAVQYNELHKENLGILNGEISDKINDIKSYTDGLLSPAFQKWDNKNGVKLFNQLDSFIKNTYFNAGDSLKNFLITAGDASDLVLTVTLPIDIAISWLNNSQTGLSSTGEDSLAYFFGEKNEDLTRTVYRLQHIGNANFINFQYNNGVSYTQGTESFKFNPDPTQENRFTKVSNTTNIQTRIYYSLQLTIKICKPSVMTMAYVLMTNPSFGAKVTCKGQTSLKGCGGEDVVFPTTTEECISTLIGNTDYAIIQSNINRWCRNYTDSYPRSDGLEKYLLNDQSPSCLCYNSHLTTNPIGNDELSLCFSKSCSLDPKNNLRSAYSLTDSKCQDDVCPTLKSLFKNEVLPPNLEDIDAGRVQELCKFNPYDRNYSYNRKILLPTLNVAIFLICLLYILLRKHEEILTIMIMVILVLTVVSGFLLASSPAACVKRSNLPEKRISKCKTPIGIELPEEYCGQKLDYCESSFDTILPNQGCPSKCCPYGTGCSNICNKDPNNPSKTISGKGKPTFYTRRNIPVIILSSLMFVGTAIILGILNFKLNKNNKKQYIVSAIILVIMLGLLIKNIVGEKTVASIYGCNATD